MVHLRRGDDPRIIGVFICRQNLRPPHSGPWPCPSRFSYIRWNVCVVLKQSPMTYAVVLAIEHRRGRRACPCLRRRAASWPRRNLPPAEAAIKRCRKSPSLHCHRTRAVVRVHSRRVTGCLAGEMYRPIAVTIAGLRDDRWNRACR